MPEKTPLSFGTIDGDACGPVSSIVEIPNGDTVTSDSIPWTGIIAGTDIDAVYSTTGVTLNSTYSGGGGGDLTGIDAGDGILVTDETTTTPLVSLDLKANSGLEIISNELAVDVDGLTINFVGGELHAINNGTVGIVTAGNGLTQTGTSTINPTLNIGAGDGIAVDSNEITLDIRTGSGLKITSEELDFDPMSLSLSGTASGVEVKSGSSVDVCATSESLDNSVLTLDTGAAKCAWKPLPITVNPAGDGLLIAPFISTYNNFNLGTNSTFITSALECKTISTPQLKVTDVMVSAYALEVGTNSTGCPIPNPFCFVRTTGAGTNSTDEQNFAIGAAVNTITSDTDDISWDNTAKHFNVSAPGTYEIIGNFLFDSGSQF